MTKFTREDYEMAAKAAGIELEWFPARVWNGFIDGYEDATDGSGTFVVGSVEWDPPEDDGDALRLMAKLHLSPRFYYGLIEMCAHSRDGAHRVIDYKLSHQDKTIEGATRRAIFRAAIAIGRAMP